MTTLNRRRFIQLGTGGAAGWGCAVAPPIVNSLAQPSAQPASDVTHRPVRLSGDGIGLDSDQYARLLAQLAGEKGIASDSYSLGGVVEELENQFARVLRKERAIFFPTGTLANHVAVRTLAGGSSRVIVQEQSHLYHDEGDCAQTLSNLTLMPLATGRATFTAEEVEQVVAETKAGRVVSRVSVISIETPVRRKQGERFDWGELQKIVSIARREGIKLHLDGARLFLQAAYTGQDVAETAAPFDTVYVSLYKYFNAASGAILAGPRSVIDGMYHVRRMFGGGLSQVWPFAAVALHYFDGFADRYSRAVRISEDLIRAIEKNDSFRVERIPSGTNLFRLRISSGDPQAFRKRLAARGIALSSPQSDAFLVGVNETLNRTTAADLESAFSEASAYVSNPRM